MMPKHSDPYACCDEGRLRPAYAGGDETMPVLGCTLCGEYIEPDPDYPGADPEWRAAALKVCPPGTGDPEENLSESDLYDPDSDPLPDGPDPDWPWLPAAGPPPGGTS